HPLRHDQVIVGNRDLSRITQTEPSAPPQVAAVGVRARTSFLPRMTQLFQLPRNLFQSPPPVDRSRGSAAFGLFIAVALLLPTPDSLADARSLAAQLLDRVATVGRSVGFDARRVDRYAPQAAHPQPSRPLDHLREHVVQRSSVTPPKLVQRPVI